MKLCEIPRWVQLKNTLRNLEYPEFINAYETSDNGILLDVRTPDEFAIGTINGAINLDYLSHALADELEELSIKKKYFVFCRTGRRSLRVCVLLQNMKYQVVNLEGGLAARASE